MAPTLRVAHDLPKPRTMKVGADHSPAMRAAGLFGVDGNEARTALADLMTRSAAGASRASSSSLQGRPVAASNCPDSHPGTFSTSYGSRNGCWVQVRRRFPDGCEHYQWFNICANVWDVNPDGSPHVYWTQCHH